MLARLSHGNVCNVTGRRGAGAGTGGMRGARELAGSGPQGCGFSADGPGGVCFPLRSLTNRLKGSWRTRRRDLPTS